VCLHILAYTYQPAQKLSITTFKPFYLNILVCVNNELRKSVSLRTWLSGLSTELFLFEDMTSSGVPDSLYV